MGKTAIILAAGKGTRMESDLPKVLHEVCNRPMLGWVIDACRAAGCERLVVVIGHKAELVREAFAGDCGDITWVEQTVQLGTGHAVMVCADELSDLSGPVLVVAGDGPLVKPETLEALMDTHAADGAACTLATCILEEPGLYGRVVRDADGRVVGIVEAIDADEAQREIKEVNVSLYCFDAATLAGVIPRLGNDNAKGEYYLTDALAILRAGGAPLAAVAAVEPEDVISINTLDELKQVDKIMRRRLVGTGEATHG